MDSVFTTGERPQVRTGVDAGVEVIDLAKMREELEAARKRPA